MTPAQLARLAERLHEFIADCFDGLGRVERRAALDGYVRGLLLDGERKSMEPIAARLVDDPRRVEAMRQRLQQAITVAGWDEETVYRRIAERVERGLAVEAFVVDDTGFPKKGYDSVGVQRQYSGTMGRIDNCQIATTLHLASEQGGACVGARLYLPSVWAEDPRRRGKVGVPEEVVFEEKWRLALGLIDKALAWGLPRHPVLADAGYGDSSDFRQGLSNRNLEYIVGISGAAVVWPPGTKFSPPPLSDGKIGRPRTRWTADGTRPSAIDELAKSLPPSAWRQVTWREGSRGPQSGRFAAVRVRTAHRHAEGRPPGDEQWLLCEWPRRKQGPTTYYLSNLPATVSRRRLVYLAKIRWRIERDYQELKSELGLDHFEGRGWVGFHHHLACVAVAHAFLTLERTRFPPEQTAPHIPGVSSPASGRASSNARPLPDVQSRHPSASPVAEVDHLIE